MELGLRGRVAVVTGSSRGIGHAVAERLAIEGAAVVINGRRDDVLLETARQVRERTGSASSPWLGTSPALTSPRP